jgi:hypothetical protein
MPTLGNDESDGTAQFSRVMSANSYGHSDAIARAQMQVIVDDEGEIRSKQFETVLLWLKWLSISVSFVTGLVWESNPGITLAWLA